jgi:transcriptional regulator with XRE-family HTH domain
MVERGTSGFAARLKQLRAEAGLSQAELARKAGMHPRGVAKLEQGERPSPSWDTVRALARALGVSCEAFDDGSTPAPEGAAAGVREEASEPAGAKRRTAPGSGSGRKDAGKRERGRQ